MNSPGGPWWLGNAVVAVFGFALVAAGLADHFWAVHPWSDETQLNLVWGGAVLATGSGLHAAGKVSPTP